MNSSRFGTRPDSASDRGPEAAARDRAAARLALAHWPPPLRIVLAKLRADGHQAYLVGGAVRDVLMGRETGEPWDVSTDHPPAEVMAMFARVEPTGLKHGTVLVREDGVKVESTTFRREGEYPDARHPESVEFTRDPLEDLARRDLTVNALAFDPWTGELIDPFGGALDLERGVLRAVGDPVARFREDALRPLRAARFAATLEMELEAGTRAALGATLDRARQVALERVREELVRMLAAPRPSVGFELLREAGLLALWMPELAACFGVPQNRYHAHDVYGHSLATLDAAPADKPEVRWAALLHDIGKPATRVERNGEGTFHDHPAVGAELADRLLARLRFAGEERARIVHLVREHMFDYRPEWSDAAVRRWLRRVGVDAVADLFDLRIADVLGNGLPAQFPSQLEQMRERIERVLAGADALTVSALAVDGHDVMRVLGTPPGPRVRAALEALLEEVLEQPALNTRETLLERLVAMRDAHADTRGQA